MQKQVDDMRTRLQPSKLVELRAKTDRQLVQLINSRLNAGLVFVRWAAESDERGQWTSREIFRDSAFRAYAEARKLLPWSRAAGAERVELELKSEQLRRGLEALCANEEHLMQIA
jgi:hypothetical protein